MTIKYFIELVVITALLSVFCWFSGQVLGAPLPKSQGQQQCESKGGIFYQGGFGADNCVFPPK